MRAIWSTTTRGTSGDDASAASIGASITGGVGHVLRSNMAASNDTLWIGRVTLPGERRQRCVRFATDGRAPGEHELAVEIDDPFLAALPSSGAEQPGDPWRLAHELPARAGGVSAPLGELQLCPPVRPGKIICVGRNYAAHARELGNEVPDEPLLFTKPASALLAAGAELELPRGFDRIDMEAELVVVIGRAGRGFAREQALDHVAGYTLGNDVSCRDLQKRDKQWTRAKGFDGFAPLGPLVRLHPPGRALDSAVRVQGFIEDTRVQDAPIADMIFDIPMVLSYIAACMTLEPGDLIFTGTPEGVSALLPGSTTAVGCVGLELGRLVTPLR
jgi:2-keto-4-pentenoate hydratase/2-oxohepta-3-ene-1,7-dioic acid hydratase in catechol pathway